jgi:hypothetical protein
LARNCPSNIVVHGHNVCVLPEASSEPHE